MVPPPVSEGSSNPVQRRARSTAWRGEQTREQVRICRLANAAGDIEGFGHQMDLASGQVEIDADARIATRERHDQRGQIRIREIHREERGTQNARRIGQ